MLFFNINIANVKLNDIIKYNKYVKIEKNYQFFYIKNILIFYIIKIIYMSEIKFNYAIIDKNNIPKRKSAFKKRKTNQSYC